MATNRVVAQVEHNVDGNKWAVITRKGIAGLRPKRAEGRHMAGRFGPHGSLEGQLGQSRGDISQETVLLVFGKTINHLETLIEFGHQLVDLFWRMLQVVVHRHKGVKPGRPNAAEECIVLSVISHQVDSADPGEGARQFLDDFPALIPAAIVDEHNFILVGQGSQRRFQSLDQHRQDQFAVVNRHHHRDETGHSQSSIH